MTMTKKDYELIAKSLHDTFSTYSSDTKERIAIKRALQDSAISLAHDLSASDPKFDKKKFNDIVIYGAVQA